MDSIFVKIAMIAGGGGMGYLYYRLIGCRSGVCPLTSTPWGSVMLGSILASIFVF